MKTEEDIQSVKKEVSDICGAVAAAVEKRNAANEEVKKALLDAAEFRVRASQSREDLRTALANFVEVALPW